MITDWMNTEVTGISGIHVEMPNEARLSIFTDNDSTHINDDHFQTNQIYVVPTPPLLQDMMMLHQML